MVSTSKLAGILASGHLRSTGLNKVTDAIQAELTQEQALAKRWLRSELRPLVHWQWLGGSHAPPPSQQRPTHALLDALSAFAQPLGEPANDHQRQWFSDCLNTVAELISQLYLQVPGQARPCVERMLAAAIVPLYRGLASCQLTEICAVLRRQLADCAALATLIQQLQPDLDEVLVQALHADKSPYEALTHSFQLDLDQITQHLLQASQKWDGTSAAELDQLVRQSTKLPARPTWAAANILWRLAGELIADRSEFVVPREWISLPVPWNEAAEHWRAVLLALRQAPQAQQLAAVALDELTASGETQLPAQVDHPPAIPASAEPSAEPSSVDSARWQSPDVVASASGNAEEEIQRLKLEIEIADAVDSLVLASRRASGRAPTSRPEGAHRSAAPAPRIDDFVVPKVIIAEVRSHNDPAFITVVRRQLGICRSEGRAMSLIAVRVIPDVDDEHPNLQSLGLAAWQQKLVNWLAEHPEVRDPYAFISSDGALILTLMDIERNTSTTLLRQGLVEILMGATLSSSSPTALNRPPMPARYFSGIGSVTAPSAGFEPEQLIDATYRCLEAVQRQGKAAIKSIEVF